MSDYRQWFKATTADGSDMTQDLIRFAEFIGLERIVPDRYSVLLLLGLFGGFQSGGLNPAKVVREIESLEGLRKGSNLKPALPFKHAPLRGLWHKHYLKDGLPTMTENLLKGIRKYGIPKFKQQIADAQISGVDNFLTEQDCARLANEIANDVTWGNWERLAKSSALTGEWLIFAKHQGKNYYLCLGQHTSGDDILRSQIDAVCLKEFPFLADILP